jgi:hypothetical protein
VNGIPRRCPNAAMIGAAVRSFHRCAPHALYFTHKDKLNADLLAFIRG